METWPRIVIAEPAPTGAALDRLFAPLRRCGRAVLVLVSGGVIVNEMIVAGRPSAFMSEA